MTKDLMDKLEGAGYSGEVPDLRGVIDLCGEEFQGLTRMKHAVLPQWAAHDTKGAHLGISPEEAVVNLYVATRKNKSQE